MNDENLYWTRANGMKIAVDNMSDTHVRNAFKLLLRRGAGLQPGLGRMVKPSAMYATAEFRPYWIGLYQVVLDVGHSYRQGWANWSGHTWDKDNIVLFRGTMQDYRHD